ncbi:PEP/pyruvate-binding domain-containing protein [Streptomyces roseochromogenus]|nr:PEP/pyruvate-binding domain-containing protein [Streptomyces roseochromogenus]
MGRAVSDAWKLPGSTITHRKLGTKKTRIERDHTRVVIREVEPADRERFCLTDDEVIRLADIGRKTADLLGGPQDIEWAITGSQIWILLARPVTSALPAGPPVAADITEGAKAARVRP